MLLAFHVGDEALRPGELLGKRIDLTWKFCPLATVTDALAAAGLLVELQLQRAPYPGEHPSVRGYVIARRPASIAG